MTPPPPARVYRLLFRRFGPQGWWPVAKPGRSRSSYHPGSYAAPSGIQSLEIVVGAVLTQNTAWTNVEKALEALRRAGAMSLEGLLRMPVRRLERLIRSSGYFRQKARRLKDFLDHAAGRRAGMRRWLSGSLAPLREELLSLRGVGPETADSILLYAGARPVFVVDAYTLRIGTRLGWFHNGSYEEAQRFLTERLRRSVRLYQEFHALFVALAKFFCRKEPLCRACPLLEDCCFGLTHATSKE